MRVAVYSNVNGFAIVGAPLELAQHLEAVATRDDDLDAATTRIETWLREHVIPR